MNNQLIDGGDICKLEPVYVEENKLKLLVFTAGDSSHFHELHIQEQEAALTWLLWNLYPAQTPCRAITSRGLKEIMEYRTGIVMTENQFKECMLLCGFYPCRVDEVQWEFKIKKSSPVFQRLVDGHPGIPMLGLPVKVNTHRVVERSLPRA